MVDGSFGYYPMELTLNVGHISISTQSELADKIDSVEKSGLVHKKWVYSPDPRWGRRIFGLPKTHRLSHSKLSGDGHFDFLIWTMSFIFGMRLSSADAGFGYIGATPTEPGMLVDFIANNDDMSKILLLADQFWLANLSDPNKALLFQSCINALYFAQYPNNMQHEEFFYLYISLDSIYSLNESKLNSKPKSHADRIRALCDCFAMPVPRWASGDGNSSDISQIRNMLFHESRVSGQPVGYGLLKASSTFNINLSLKALMCRLLVASLGAETEYVSSPTDTRMRYSLGLK
jgi:hypothetical protein